MAIKRAVCPEESHRGVISRSLPGEIAEGGPCEAGLPTPAPAIASSRKKCFVGNVKRMAPFWPGRSPATVIIKALRASPSWCPGLFHTYSLPGFWKWGDQPETDSRKVLRFSQSLSGQMEMEGGSRDPWEALPASWIPGLLPEWRGDVGQHQKASLELAPCTKLTAYALGHVCRLGSPQFQKSFVCRFGGRACLSVWAVRCCSVFPFPPHTHSPHPPTHTPHPRYKKTSPVDASLVLSNRCVSLWRVSQPGSGSPTNLGRMCWWREVGIFPRLLFSPNNSTPRLERALCSLGHNALR